MRADDFIDETEAGIRSYLVTSVLVNACLFSLASS
jgi:hypothetical protein